MKNKKFKPLFTVLLLVLVLALAGCSSQTSSSQIVHPVGPNSPGIWTHYFVYPLSWFIKQVASICGGNYGLSIIIVTILIRLALLPLMIKQIRSTKAMQAIQPEMMKLKEKYSSKDQNTMKKLNEETMKLYQQHGVNPLSGCLPLFIQMPILMAFYSAIRGTEEIFHNSFLWFKLGEHDPYYILPVLAGITTFLSQKASMANNPATGPAAQQMKIMLYIMPVMIMFFATNLPAALALYWVVGNVFMIVQTMAIKIPDAKHNVGGASK
ncbi:membrane protein insertase YidC [Bacillus sp. RG28]|uniref:Membrane protein insertase YidC n=1 Tax=Gottfriedia endophytica TaxID=2820819 RepID=A0A940NLU8_9BACI|nr:membrane protein insertase YidC [Gottfriedia endophytica]MBP0724896.1 membrane protein insertase YidC [Gottfriedia endophytica]